MTSQPPPNTFVPGPSLSTSGQSQAVAPIQPSPLISQSTPPTPDQALSTTTAYPRLQAVVIMIGLLLAPICTLGAAVIAQNDKAAAKVAVDCQAAWSQAIKLHDEHPGVSFPYDGPVEDQCHVSKVLEQLNSKSGIPVPLPGPTP